MEDDLLATIITGVPNFVGFFVGYVIMWRVVAIQHATINRCLDALVTRANCDEDHLQAAQRRMPPAADV